MNYDDLLNKWLFVAYSAKVTGRGRFINEGKEIIEKKSILREYLLALKVSVVFHVTGLVQN